MRIILSPAKKMKINTDSLAPLGKPIFAGETEAVLSYMKSLSFDELMKLWGCSEKLARENFDRLENMNLDTQLTPAILSYEGIAYQYMAPAVFEYGHFDYIQEHLRILSAFYGVLKPMDGVTPYRLEMQAKAKVCGSKNLYEFWGRKLYDEVRDESDIIINLASKEYSKCIEPYLTDRDCFITIDFVEESKGRLVTKGTYAKMARGEMVRYMAENQIKSPEEIKSFDRLGYVFREELSDESRFVFERVTSIKK